MPLLADPDHAVARLYGVGSRLTGTKRATFLVDEAGTVVWKKVHAVGLTYVTVDELQRVIAGLPAAAG
ncbi:alkyl hydroperoxide reductase subunit AhpC [Conexibacter arvalis]|uniref:Alkyl hydroperoxide reductase subunit AhpC n=1 Tax=Conexibacter arvalis TaxID=912552 RepID=A0A840IHX7_9ACTN|nr:alkyl hydroperoxide reductase subunit AhpC [Conexibacter arvalis]